ncbi:hypothetical protein EHQ92_02985 [Leptospira biflexa]|jgi:hypothetical protein|uniref:Flagellar motor switch protein FliG C-terminal domain-containing protein n=1 Tax=Leptospira biflexa serovar Patoc (strain Patoc 1 / ATCC 23582 / Paris) TaxID=456481 RepID=B0SRB2_LEPBP|nr:hypothetical protein [Leptospira biflexa]ABZ95693.1 Hypothetical protein LBF_3225 [Leptospira biflexa serovar Patoc strain 'Patoc 1 (Ames)']ABZ99404.1 Conserved hypothetical protein [Leptospira biflexa serovar Patoc strain 'Patoc 1 (Paris)']TGM37371.1 hypothetical protein EHQ80_07135 [Leptospira biflexa]TGM40708.1 hypothetical protein EHQ89_01700 [Leptospira biflexa]TGM46912.1 hypothetical protein EHQ92_02985 [Leptospira biflexa]
MSGSEQVLEKLSQLSYFDNLALYYLCNETPPQTLALAFLQMDEKIAGSMLGVLDLQRRKYVHELMALQKDSAEESKKAAAEGLLLIADGLISRNLISKQGQYFFGTKK